MVFDKPSFSPTAAALVKENKKSKLIIFSFQFLYKLHTVNDKQIRPSFFLHTEYIGGSKMPFNATSSSFFGQSN